MWLNIQRQIMAKLIFLNGKENNYHVSFFFSLEISEVIDVSVYKIEILAYCIKKFKNNFWHESFCFFLENFFSSEERELMFFT